MSDQPEFFSFESDKDGFQRLRGMHRIPDHVTSVEAAQYVAEKISKLQQRVIEAFKHYGAMTDEELRQLPGFTHYAESTVRKRRTELYQKGVIEIVGAKTNSYGRTMNVWNLK